MDSIWRGEIASTRGRAVAWVDALLVDHGVFRLFWTNRGEVVPGRLLRSNHPTPRRLAVWARRHGVRTVVNLRGQCSNGADALSRDAAARLDLSFIDAPLQSSRAPPRESVLALAQAMAAAPAPVLIHCKSGADRAGFAAAVFLLAQGATVAEAKRQLSWRFGHLRWSRTGVLDAVLARYAADAEGRRPFLDWVREEYDPEAVQAGFRAGRLGAFIQDRVLRRE